MSTITLFVLLSHFFLTLTGWLSTPIFKELKVRWSPFANMLLVRKTGRSYLLPAKTGTSQVLYLKQVWIYLLAQSRRYPTSPAVPVTLKRTKTSRLHVTASFSQGAHRLLLKTKKRRPVPSREWRVAYWRKRNFKTRMICGDAGAPLWTASSAASFFIHRCQPAQATFRPVQANLQYSGNEPHKSP